MVLLIKGTAVHDIYPHSGETMLGTMLGILIHECTILTLKILFYRENEVFLSDRSSMTEDINVLIEFDYSRSATMINLSQDGDRELDFWGHCISVHRKLKNAKLNPVFGN